MWVDDLCLLTLVILILIRALPAAALSAHTAQALATACPEPVEGPVSAAIANAKSVY